MIVGGQAAAARKGIVRPSNLRMQPNRAPQPRPEGRPRQPLPQRRGPEGQGTRQSAPQSPARGKTAQIKTDADMAEKARIHNAKSQTAIAKLR